MMGSREVWGLRDGIPTNKGNTNKQGKHQQTRETPTNRKKTPTNKKKQEKNTNKQEKHQQTRETPFEQGKRHSSKGYLPIKCKSLQVVGVSRQGKAVVRDGWYGVIGG